MTPSEQSDIEPLNIRLTAGDAEMVVSWAEAALREMCPNNSILRESVDRFRRAFNQAAHERLMGTVEVIPVGECVLVEDAREALDAIDDYAAKDMDHELHALVEHYRSALGCRS